MYPIYNINDRFLDEEFNVTYTILAIAPRVDFAGDVVYFLEEIDSKGEVTYYAFSENYLKDLKPLADIAIEQ